MLIEKVSPFFELNNCNFDLNFLLLFELKCGIWAKFTNFDSVLHFNVRNGACSDFRIIKICSITAFEHFIGYFNGNRKKMLSDLFESLGTKCKENVIKWNFLINLDGYFIDFIGFDCEIDIHQSHNNRMHKLWLIEDSKFINIGLQRFRIDKLSSNKACYDIFFLFNFDSIQYNLIRILVSFNLDDNNSISIPKRFELYWAFLVCKTNVFLWNCQLLWFHIE